MTNTKEYKRSTLNSYTKQELIDLIMCMQNNMEAMTERLNTQAANFMAVFDRENDWKEFNKEELPLNQDILIRLKNGVMVVGSWNGYNFWVNVKVREWATLDAADVDAWKEIVDKEFPVKEKEIFLERLDATLDYKTLHEKNYGWGKYSLMDIINGCLEGREI